MYASAGNCSNVYMHNSYTLMLSDFSTQLKYDRQQTNPALRKFVTPHSAYMYTFAKIPTKNSSMDGTISPERVKGI